MKYLLRALRPAMLAAGIALTLGACSTPTQAPQSPEPTPTQAPSSSAQPTAPPALSQDKEIMGVGFKLPAKWTAAGEDCEAACSEYDRWEIKDESGQTVFNLLPNTATSPDGDMNTYQREVLKSVPVPQLTTPTSLIAEFYTATDQEDGEQETGFSIALVDDQVLKDRTEMPDLDYFKLGPNKAPMFWVEADYLEAQGLSDEPTLAQAQEFLRGADYQMLESIMLTVRHAAG